MNGDSHEDDRDVVIDEPPEPMCSWCDDKGWRWTIRGDRAEMVRCDKCWEGEDE